MEFNFVSSIEKYCKKKKNIFETDFLEYIIRAFYAGFILTIVTLAAVIAGDHLNAINIHLGKFVYAFIFAFNLLYVLFFGMELASSNMMYLSSGVALKKIKIFDAIKILLVCTVFNLVGAIVASYLMNACNIFSNLTETNLIVSIVNSKIAQSNIQIFFSAILANIFVCLGVLSYMILKSETAKIITVMAMIFMFVYIGLDHVVANFGSFSMLYLTNFRHLVSNFEILNILRQWTFAFIGNLVGGGLIIGLSFSYINRKK